MTTEQQIEKALREAMFETYVDNVDGEVKCFVKAGLLQGILELLRKKVTYPKIDGRSWEHCAKCDCILFRSYKYCPECGKKIDWIE